MEIKNNFTNNNCKSHSVRKFKLDQLHILKKTT